MKNKNMLSIIFRRRTFFLLGMLLAGGMASAQVVIEGNVYGGGNIGEVVKTADGTGNTTVIVNGGTVGKKLGLEERKYDKDVQITRVDYGNVYGGGNGYEIIGTNPNGSPIFNPNAGRVQGNTTVYVGGEAVVRRAVYGGGNIATVGIATIPQQTGIAAYESGGQATVTITGNALIGPKMEDLTTATAEELAASGIANQDAYADSAFKYLGGNEGWVFGSSRGISGGALRHLSFVDETFVTINGNAQVMNVFGSGENGHVQTSTNVIVGGNAIVGGVPLHGTSTPAAYTVVGGAYNGATLHLKATEGELIEDEYGVGREITRGNVFGGGKGSDFISWFANPKYCYTSGRVYGNTHVTIEENAKIYNRVFGGGLIAMVGTFVEETSDDDDNHTIIGIASGGHTYVNINGGTIGSFSATAGLTGLNNGDVYGGGRGLPGRPRKPGTGPHGLEPLAPLHQVVDEAYVGHTHVTVTDGTIYNSVYGGGANGHVQGNTYVTINGGTIGHDLGGWHGNVFAGGGGTARYKENNALNLSITAGRVFGDTYLEITGGHVLHNVYGGGAIASVGTYNASELINPTHPYLGFGHSKITITGGEIGTNGDNNGMVFGSGRGEIAEPGNFLDYVTYVAFSEVNIGTGTVNASTGEASNLSGNAKINGSVYGSGENGHTYMEAVINVFGGTIGCTADEYAAMTADEKEKKFPYRGNVYGAGCGTDQYIVSIESPGTTEADTTWAYNPLAGVVQGNTKVNIYGGKISRSVYGAGAVASVGSFTIDEAHTNTNTSAALSWPYKLTYTTITDANNEPVTTGKTEVNIRGGHIGTLAAPVAESGNVFGSARGDVGPLGTMETMAIVRETEVEVNFAPPTGNVTDATPNVIIGSVYGSGENGTVYENTKVTMTNGLVRGSVFGGGDGTDTYMVALKDPNNPSSYLDPSPQRSITSGKVYGNTEVVINGGQVLHNVYGGGNLASVGKGSYMGYGELTNVSALPEPYQNSGICTVTVNGGTIGTTGYPGDGYNNGFVFGSSKGTTFATVDNPEGTARYDYSRDFFLGYVNKTIVNIGDADANVTTGPTVKGAVFGGGDNGHVRWHTYVNVNKGEIGEGYVPTDGNITDDKWAYRGNVYGAGQGTDMYDSDGDGRLDSYCPSAGSVTLNTNVTVNGGTIHRNVYGGGSMATVGPLPTTDYDPGTSTCTVNINGGTIGQVVTPTSGAPFNYGGNVYGAGRGIIDEHAPLTQYAAAVNTEVNVQIGNETDKVIGNVYGGGSYGQVQEETNVNMKAGHVKGSVFGGGMGFETEVIAGLVKGNATVDMTGGTIERSIYGGGQMGSVGTFTTYNDVIYNEGQANAFTVQVPTACAENTGLTTVRMSGGNVGLLGSLMPWEDHNPDDDDRGWIFCGGQGVADSITYPKAIALGVVNCTHLQISNTTSGENTIRPVVTASVYGGAENGLVLDSTFVEIAGGQIGTGHYKTGTTHHFDPIYEEDKWTTAITAINNGTIETALGTSGSLHDVFHECDAWEYSNNQLYDIFADETGYNSQGGALVGTNGHSFFGNVFGGGSGYYPIKAGVWRRTAGQVNGNTRVEITGGHILTAVYGGNETTDVKGKSTVKMNGGTVGIPRTAVQIAANPLSGNIYGAGMGDPRSMFNTMTNVKKTQVYLTGGTVFGNVYGGSREGHVLDSTLVVIGQEQGKSTLIGTTGFSGFDGLVFGGGMGNVDYFDAQERKFPVGRVGGNTHVRMTDGKVLGSIYGGGLVALGGVNVEGWIDSPYDEDNHGLAKVEVSGGVIGNYANEGLDLLLSDQHVGNVFGGGRGSVEEYREDDLGRVGNAVVKISGSPTVYGSVYGGGQMANVGFWNDYDQWYEEGTASTKVTISGTPTIGTQKEFDPVYSSGTGSLAPKWTYYDVINGVKMINHTLTGNVYGGGKGDVKLDEDDYVVGLEHGHCGSSEVSISGTPTIRSSVFGGSERGAVWGDAKVNITGGTIGTVVTGTDQQQSTYNFGSVFGGSYGADAYQHFDMNPSIQTLEYLQKVDSVNLLAGRVYGNTSVDITGGVVRGNVFGGGDMASVGIWDKVLDGNDNLIDIVAKNDPDRPAFRGNATVNVGGEAVIGPLDNTGLNAYVFGGGKGFSYDPDELRKAYSNVDSTFVTINGGKIWGSVYGGGSDSHVLGSTSVIVHSGANIGDDGLSTWDGNIFGGGRNFFNSNHTNGRVAGNVTIDMDGGTIQGSVFGGGRMALTGVNMLGNPYVTEHAYDSAFNNKPIHGLATINVSGTATTANGVTTYSTNIGNPNGNDLLNDSNESVGDVFGSGKGDTKNYEDILAGRVANTKVGISGSPRIYGSVFGGGEMAGVGYWYTEDGKAKFYDKSGTSEVTIGREGESDNPVIGTDYEFTQEYAATNPEWTIYDDDGIIIHTCTGNVFGGCQGDVDITAPHWVSMGRSRNAKVVVNGGTIKSRVFGGAEQGSMAGNTSVVINGGTIGTLVTMSTNGGGGNGDGRDGETQYYIGGVYGGGYGSHNPAYNVTHNNDSTNISSDLLAGRVYGNARVDVLGGTVQGSVFGGASFAYLGGYGTNPHGNTKVYIGSESQMGIPDVGTTILGGVYGANNYNGTPYGDVEVHVYHTAHTGQPTTAGGNAYPTVPASGATPEWLATIPNGTDNFALYQVFGGGNRANYTPKLAANKATVHVYGCEENTIYELYGGGNAAEIGSATAGYTTDANVIIEGGRIHSVFGGGNGNPDPANIYGIATTSVEGGLIDELFGGSNGYGNVNEINLVVAEDSDCELAIVNGYGGGNISPEIGEIIATLECCSNPTPYNNFYGGAHSAVIYGNVTLNVYGGKVTNLFGGSEGSQGIPADIKKYPIDWQTGDYSDEVKAFMQSHQDLAGTGGNVTVNLYGGTHTNVFGGCDVNGNIEGVVTVNVLDVEENCPLKIANIYGASNETPYTPDDIIVENVPQKPVSPVINVVHIKDTDGISQNVFGAGKGNTATVTSNPMVNIGYNHATMAQYIPLDANGDSIYHVQGRTPRAYVKGSVYGGGEYGKVIGNPSVNINRSNTVVDNFVYGAGCGNDTDIDCAKVTGGTTVRIIDGLIKRSVFGGGEMAIVTGDTRMEMSGGTVGSWETIGDEQRLHGSIYGGGQGSPNPVNEQNMDAADYGRVNGNTYIDISGNAHILKDVYGGGQMGSVGNGNLSDNTTGVAHVTISGGQIGPFVADKKNANVYGGGQGEVDENYISHYITHANVDSTSVIVCDSALIYGSVFGGSANGHVLAGTRVLVEKGNNTKDKKPIIGTDGMHGGDGHVYGGGQGNTSNFSAGRVGGNTKVVMTDGTVMGCIYGGGNVALTGVDVDGTFASFIDDDQKYDSIQHGMAEVVVSGGIIGNPANDGLDLLRSNQKLGNIYGGGRGDPNEYLEDDFGRAANADVSISGSPTIYGSVFGGGQMANVGHWNNYSDWYTTQTGTTRVTINGAPQIGTALEFDHDNYAIAEPLPIKTLYDTINDVRMISHTSTGNVFGGGQGDMIIDEEGDAEGFEQGHCCTTIVNINMNDGGHIMSSVFGGSEQGAVWGDTKVKIERGVIGTSGIEADSLDVDLDEWVTASNLYRFGSVFGGSYGVDSYKHLHSNDAAVADTANSYAGRVYGNTYVNITGGSICGNVFGGGNMASVGYWNKVLDDNDNLIDFVPAPYPNTIGIKGHAKVNVSGAAIIGPLDPNGLNASVYGGGKGIGDDPDDLRKKYGNVNSTEVTINLGETGHVYGSVFGGGADGHVLRDAVVNITGGTIGTTGLHDDGLVFGGGQGTSGSFSAGRVGGSTEVIMTDGTVLGNIYGGGSVALTGVDVNGSFESYESLVDGVHVYDSIRHGLARVEVSGGTIGNHNHSGLDLLLNDLRVGNIYGGGRGDLNEFREDDFGRSANAMVHIYNSPTIYGSVYGGGQMANVGRWNDYDTWYTQKTGATKVTIDGTPTIGTEKEFDYAYSTGTGANAPKWTLYEVINGMRMITYTRTGNVYGSGQGNIKLDNDGYVVGTEHGHCRTTEVNISGTPTIMSSVYGGAEQGAVWGDTKVNITGGTIGTENIVAGNSNNYSYGSVYGGSYGMDAYTHLNLTNPSQQVLDSVNGLAGHVYGNTFVNITGGTVRCNVFGGGDMASVGEWNANFVPVSNTGNATVNVSGSAIVGPMDGTGLNAYVFGGGKGIGNDPYNLRKEYCNINSTNVTVELNEAGDNVGRVYGSLYGGGSDCHVLGDTYVTLNSGVIGTYDAEHSTISSWGGNIFGGGRNFLKKNYAAGRVAGNTHVEMKGGTVYGAIFGGGRHAVTGAGLDGMTMLDGENHGNTNVAVKGGIVGCEDIVTSFIVRPIGEVYGGGKGSMEGITLSGHPSASALFISLVKNTNVEISQANPAVPTRILNTVYGGGETANVGHYTWTTDPNGYEISNIAMKPGTGKTNVTIKGGIIGVDRSVMSYALVPDTYTLACNPVGNVFGGGKGLSDNPANYAQGISTVYGHKNLVDIMGTVGSTTVTVENTSETIRPWVKGSVFGGSASGHVLRDTEVTIAGGQIGAGNSGTADVWYTDGEDNNQFFNPIEYFETEHTDLDDVASEDALYECYHWPYTEPYRPFDILEIAAGNYPCDGKTWFGNVYGGGSGFLPYITRNYNNTADTAVWNRESGKVYGNTKVTITGGHILTNVYGGCETADVGLYDDNLNNISGGNDTIIMTGGTIGVPRTLAQIAAHPLTCYLFGAGKGDPRTQFDTWTNVDSVYVEVSGGIIYGSVFGGGEEGHVMNDVEVVIKDEAIIGTSYVEGNVFGGGRGYSGEALTAGTVGGNVKVDIQDGIMLGSVYGGGCLASVGTHFTAPENDNYGQFQEDTEDKTHGYVTIDISGGRIGNTHEYLYSPDPEHPEKKLEATYGGNVFAGAMGRLTKLDGTTINPLWPSLGKVKQTEVTVSGNAEIWSSVYGGGQFGTVRDNATVNIMGGTIGTDVKHPDYNGTSNNKHYHFGSVYGGGLGSKDMRYDGIYANDSTESNLYKRPVEIAGRVYGNTFVNISGGQVLENVFGGGEVASVGMVKDGNFVKGVATVIVNGGEVGPMDMNGLNAHVYGGSKGVDKDEDNAYKAYCNVNETHVTVEKHIGEGGDVVSSPQVWGSVFGGGSDGHVLGDAAVNFNGGTLGTTGETTLDGNIFGGGRNFSASNLTAGRVGGNATVTVTEGHMLGSIFGGGRLGSVGIDEDGNMQEGNNHGFTLVNVGGDAQTGEIKIGHGAANDHDQVGGNVYGSGKGIAGPSTSIYPKLAQVKQTVVNIKEREGFETWIEGSVFGSGEDGHVLKDTYVNIFGGQIGGHDYGDLTPCADPYHGNVYGAGRGIDTYTQGGTQYYSATAGIVRGNTNVNMYGGHIVRNVYGGGNLASVGNANETPDANGNYHTGLASVTIVGGTVGTINENENFGNVFGSGHGGSGDEYVNLAYVKNTHVTIGQTARIYGSVFGGGEDGHVRMNAIVDIEGGIIGDAGDVVSQPLDGNVYGGGRGLLLDGESQTAGEVYGYTTVNIKNSTYNGVNYSPVIWNNVFGGGSQSVVRQYKVVNMSGGLVHGSVFGGSREIPAQRPNTAPRWVNMWGGRVEGNVYGCSYLGTDGDPDHPTDFASFVNLSGGTIGTDAKEGIENGNVYGAGYGGMVKGSVAVLIGKNAIVETSKEGGEFEHSNIHKQETPVISNLDIKGSVFGGSFGTGGSTEWDHSFNVTGYSRVYIDGTDYNTTDEIPDPSDNDYMYIRGGVYGCGTNCESGEKGRNILVRNYGTRINKGGDEADKDDLVSATRTLTTIQRGDIILLDNTNVNLSGAADISQSDSERAFAVLQVDKGVYVTNASGIVLGSVGAPAYMDSIHEVRSLYLKDNSTTSYLHMNAGNDNSWEWIGIKDNDNHLYRIHATGDPTQLATKEENVIIFNGDSRLYVRYLDESGPAKKRMYGLLQGFFRMRSPFSPRGTESFAYARPKLTPKNNPIRVEEFDNSVDTRNEGDGGFLSYDNGNNFFTQPETVLYYTYTTTGDDGGSIYTKTKQYPYFNIGEYVLNRESSEMDMEEFREWVLPTISGKIWYVDGRGIGNGGWGKDDYHQLKWGHFPDMPKETITGDMGIYNDINDNIHEHNYEDFSPADDIIYVVGPVEAIKEKEKLNKWPQYQLKLYRYPGRHMMSNDHYDETVVVDAEHPAIAPDDEAAWNGQTQNSTVGPGANLGMMIHANKTDEKGLVLENVLVDGLFTYSNDEITAHSIPPTYTNGQKYKVNKPMVVTTENAKLTLKSSQITLDNDEIVTYPTILQRGYNGIDVSTITITQDDVNYTFDNFYLNPDFDGTVTVTTQGDTPTSTNYTIYNGGALFVDEDATVNVEGLVTITGNKQRHMDGSEDETVDCNVYLPTFEKSLTITGALTAEDNVKTLIGITSPIRNKADHYKKNTFSPVAVAHKAVLLEGENQDLVDKALAFNAWTNNNFYDDQNWFFVRDCIDEECSDNIERTTYYCTYSENDQNIVNKKTLYFGWTWANVVRKQPVNGYLSEDVNDFSYQSIDSPEDLAWLISVVNGENEQTASSLETASIKQTADIDLIKYVWVPIGSEPDSKEGDHPFGGMYDGQGHLITNLSIEYIGKSDHHYERSNYGLFGMVDNGKINRTFAVSGLIKPESVPIIGDKDGDNAYNIGGLVGYLNGVNAEVTNSESALKIVCPNYNFANKVVAGGLVGQMANGHIHSSMAMPFMSVGAFTTGDVGGLIGKSLAGDIFNSFVNAQFGINDEGEDYPKTVGGLLGTNQGAVVENCYVSMHENTIPVNFPMDGLVKSVEGGSISKCYLEEGYTSNLIADVTLNKNFTPASSADKYGYMYLDNTVPITEGNETDNKPMFRVMNQWVKDKNGTGHTYARWARPGLQEINDDLPVLLIDNYSNDANAYIGQGGFRSVGTYAGGYALQYGGPDRDGEGNTPDYDCPDLDGALVREGKNDYLFIYGDITTAPTQPVQAAKVSIHEDVSILHSGSLTTKLASSKDGEPVTEPYTDTYVGITFDNSCGKATSTPGINYELNGLGMGGYPLPRDWHMFSTPLSAAPLGFNYMLGENNTNTSGYPEDGDIHGDYYNNPWENGIEFSWLNGGFSGNNRYWMYGWENSQGPSNLTASPSSDWVDGYFPSQTTKFGTDLISGNGSDESSASGEPRYPYGMDFYTWTEPDYHWINFKRNGPNHWHSDANNNDYHWHLDYKPYGVVTTDYPANVNEDNLIVGRGYMASIGTETFMQSHGTLNAGDKGILLTNTASSKLPGWNLVGNPYHGYLDFNMVGTANSSVLGTVNINTNEGSQDVPFYVIYDADKYNEQSGKASTAFRYYPVTSSINGDYADRYLHPHQGFYVKAKSGGGTLKFTEDMLVSRANVGTGGDFRDERPAYPLVNLYLSSDKGCADVTVIEFNRPEWGGARKLKELRVGDGLFYGHHDGTYYAALFAEEGVERVPLWFEAKDDDIFTIKWNTANGDFHSMYLIDNIAGVQYDMLRNDTYSFEGHKGDYPSRFYIVFDVTGVDEFDDGDHNFVFFDGSQWVVTGDGLLEFIDVHGRVLWQKTVSGQSRVGLPNVACGMYLMRLTNNEGTRVQKVIIDKK